MQAGQQPPGSKGDALWRVVEHSSSVAEPGSALCQTDSGGGCVGPRRRRQQLMPNLHAHQLKHDQQYLA